MSSPAELTILFGAAPEALSLGTGETGLGRSPSHGIAIEAEGLAPQVATISTSKGRWWLEAASEPGHVAINGCPVERRTELRTGDLVHLGPVGLRFRIRGRTDDKGDLVVFGKRSRDIAIGPKTALVGRAPNCDAILPGAAVALLHARIEPGIDGILVVALAQDQECRINGQHFDSRVLVVGDRVELGGFFFEFDGRALRRLAVRRGASVSAENLTLTAGGRRILDRVSLQIPADEFVGILGPTGAGKSSLLSVLSGLKTATAGRVSINGVSLDDKLADFRREFGWVPQEDIVHRELTVAQALSYAARLRLPAATPEREMARLVVETAAVLGLEQRMGSVIGSLSGGELKKASVAAELLRRPRLLFLDEPTSGLDPGAETKLVELLRTLADGGCTVVATTHTMANVHLYDRIVVMSDGLVVFSGPPEAACTFFGVPDAAQIFRRLDQRKASEWREIFLASHATTGRCGIDQESPEEVRPRRALQTPVLLSRQGAIFASDWRNPALLVLQPLLIGALLAWAVRGTSDDDALKLFFISVATLWFGCSNGAQAIVGETAIYRRERMIGLRRRAYACAKWAFVAALTLFQAALLYGAVVLLPGGLDGDRAWQAAGLTAISAVGAGIGLAISTFARNPMQAVLLVPMVIIPQIILSGYTVPASSMAPAVRSVSEMIPSFQLQRVADTSLLWQRTIDAALLQSHFQAFENVNAAMPLKLGDVVRNPTDGLLALAALCVWIVALFTLVVVGLRGREDQP